MKKFNEFVASKQNMLVENFAHDAIFVKLKNAAIKDFEGKDPFLINAASVITMIQNKFRLEDSSEGNRVMGLLNDFARELVNLIKTSKKTVQGGMHGIGSVKQDIENMLGKSYLALQYFIDKTGGETNEPNMFGKLKNFVTGNSGRNTNPWHDKDNATPPRGNENI